MATKFPQTIKQLFRMGLPFITGRLSVGLRMFLITVMAAKLNLLSLAALGLATPLFLITISFIAGAIAAPISAFAQQTTDANQTVLLDTLQQGLWFVFLISTPLAFILYNGSHLFALFGEPIALIHLLSPYCHLLALSVLPSAGIVFFQQIYVCVGKAKRALLFLPFSTPVILFLSYLFAFGKLGLPEFGLNGFALATAIGLWLLLIIILLDLHRTIFNLVDLLGTFRKPDFSRMKLFFLNGYAAGLRLSSFSILFIASAIIIGHYYPHDLAYFQIVYQCFLLSYVLSSGIAQAALIKVSQIKKMGDRYHINRIVQAASCLNFLCLLPISMIMFFFPTLILMTFNVHVTYVQTQLVIALQITTLFLLIDSIRLLLSQTLVSLQDAHLPLVIEIVLFWGLGSLWFYEFISQRHLNAFEAYWTTLLISSLLSAALLYVRFLRKTRQLKKEILMKDNLLTKLL